MSPKKLLVLLGPALLVSPCAGAERGTPNAVSGGLGAVSSAMSSPWNKQGLRRGAPSVDGTALRCGALSSQALCVRARGAAIVEVKSARIIWLILMCVACVISCWHPVIIAQLWKRYDTCSSSLVGRTQGKKEKEKKWTHTGGWICPTDDATCYDQGGDTTGYPWAGLSNTR